MMAEDVGLWTWRSLSEGVSQTEVTDAHIARIRDLSVNWDEAESGAAVLAAPDGTAIEALRDEPDEEGFLNALEVFMRTATLADYAGMIRNPYARASKDDCYGLENTPSRDVADQLLSGQDIDYRAAPDEVTLWQNANRRLWGIDSKRPFGSENVSRDVRALIDPDKVLSNAAFAKRRKWLESRMLLMLLFFAQNATLAPGLWRRGEDWTWRLVGPDDPPPLGEPLTRSQWIGNMYLQNHYENEDYTQTVHALIHLARDKRISGSYSEQVRQFSLHNHFDSRIRVCYEGSFDERFRAALLAFPERGGDEAFPWFTLSYARILNAQARFDEARVVLETSGLFEIDRDTVDFSTINTTAIAWAEGLIARHGCRLLSDDEYQAALFGKNPDWYVRPALWSFISDIHRNPDRFAGGAEEPSLVHARALAAQLELSGPIKRV